jgi:hypothetical protein
VPNVVVLFSVSTVVSDEFDHIVLSAKLFNLLDGSVFLQLSLCALFHCGMDPLVVRVPVGQQAIR